MFDIRHATQVLAGAAVGVLALGLVTAPGAAGTMSQFSVVGAGASVQAAQNATRKATGSLRVVVNRAGGYTVVGDGVRRRADSSRTFAVPPGTYAVTAPGGRVRPRKWHPPQPWK